MIKWLSSKDDNKSVKCTLTLPAIDQLIKNMIMADVMGMMTDIWKR